MKKLYGFLIFLVFSFLATSQCFGAGKIYKGYFVTTDGKTQPVGEFLFREDMQEGDCKFVCRYEGNRVEIPMSDIKSLTVVDYRTVIVTKRDGEQFKVSGTDKDRHPFQTRNFPLEPYGNLQYTFYDKINGRYSKGSIHCTKVKQIVLDEDFGQLRKCPKCGKTFPPDYMFCPYDKAPMKLIQVE